MVAIGAVKVAAKEVVVQSDRIPKICKLRNAIYKLHIQANFKIYDELTKQCRKQCTHKLSAENVLDIYI